MHSVRAGCAFLSGPKALLVLASAAAPGSNAEFTGPQAEEETPAAEKIGLCGLCVTASICAVERARRLVRCNGAAVCSGCWLLGGRRRLLSSTSCLLSAPPPLSCRLCSTAPHPVSRPMTSAHVCRSHRLRATNRKPCPSSDLFSWAASCWSTMARRRANWPPLLTSSTTTVSSSTALHQSPA